MKTNDLIIDNSFIRKKDTQTTPLTNADILKIFNLESKRVETIEVTSYDNKIYVAIKLIRTVQTCPLCKTQTTQIHNYVHKRLTHSILNGIPCYIDYNARRHRCPCCKKTFYEHNPFTFDGMKITLATVYNVLRDLKNFNETFTSTAIRNNISITQVINIFDDYVNISRKKLGKYLCIDEVYAFKSSDSKYVCVLLDFNTQNIIDVLPSRKKYELLDYLEKIPLEERSKVEIVSTDMWETYRIVTKRRFPNAVVAVDKFHILQEMNRRLMKIRIKVMNEVRVSKNIDKTNLSKAELVKISDRNKQYYLLKKFQWLLHTNDEYILDENRIKKYNKVLSRYCNYTDLLELILQIDSQLKEAFELNFLLSQFYKKNSYETAKYEINILISQFEESNVVELQEFARTLMKWKHAIINSFIIVDDEKKRKINNGVIENINKTIKNIKHNSNGYTNWNRFRNRVLYVVNKDSTFQLYSKKHN